MVDGKSKAKKGRKPKTARGGAVHSQRTLRDMFGRDGPSTAISSQETEMLFIEIPDSDPVIDIETMPPSPTGTDALSELTSIASLNESVENTSSETLLQPKSSGPPKNIHPFFLKREKLGTQSTTGDIEHALHTHESDISHGLMQSQISSDLGTPTKASTKALIEGTSREAPIVLDSSPIQPNNSLRSAANPKPVWSIFSKKSKVQEQPAPKFVPTLPAPHPDKDSQHVRGFQTPPDPYVLQFGRRPKGPSMALEDSVVSLTHLRAQSAYPIDATPPIHLPQTILDENEYIDTIPRQHQANPTVLRLLQSSGTHSDDLLASQQHWSDRWRPKYANQVLGNEECALYLRDWLVAQRLHSESLQPSATTKSAKSGKHKGENKKRKLRKGGRPDIIRQVKKRKTAWEELEEDFLAPDDLDDGYSNTGSYSDFGQSDYNEFFERLHSGGITAESSRASSPIDPLDEVPAPSLAHRPTRFGNQISNTILLAGPSGSGKTAAVYACAAELGWEVFEVYPGIGDRSGTELNKWIGDVGKNHTVKAANQVAPPIRKDKLKGAFFERTRPGSGRISEKGKGMQDTRCALSLDEESLESTNGSDDEPAIDNLAVTVRGDMQAATELTVNQSIILIEEVDVLYQSDTNFWPALINIIKDCRRPVVLTCNDVSLVPCHNLPLQDTLYFKPCPAPLATSYLQALCLTEGKQVSREDLTRLYETARDSEEYPVLPDLRHTINELQFRLSSTGEDSGSTQQVNSDLGVGSPDADRLSEDAEASSHSQGLEGYQILNLLRGMEKRLETRSFIDSTLSRESITPLQEILVDECPPSLDDQLGYTLLYSPLDTDYIPISPFYHQDRQIVEQVLRLTNNVYPTLTDDFPTSKTPIQDDSQLTYEARMGSVLARIRSWSAPATSKTALYTDYDPWIRYMVAADDAQEAQAAAVGLTTQSRRQTRNSQRRAQDRWLVLQDNDRELLVSSAFPKDPDDVV